MTILGRAGTEPGEDGLWPVEPRHRVRWPIVVGIVLMVAAVLIVAGVFLMNRSANVADPSNPDKVISLGKKGEAGKDGFAKIDWSRWQRANRSIVGWIEVPGTSVSYPIVRAPKSDPDFYLHHDVHRRWNVYGAVYLDAESDAGLLTSDNSVVLGHHMNDGSMFAQLGGYSGHDWAKAHSKVLVQTPRHKVVYRVRCANVVNGLSERKVVGFESGKAFRDWRHDIYGASSVRLSRFRGDRVLSLVTCSYHVFGNERTIAYCEPAKVDGKKVTAKKCREALGRTPYEKADANRADMAAAKRVSDEISALARQDSPDPALVQAVRSEYDGLTKSQQKLVENYSDLVEAEENGMSAGDVASSSEAADDAGDGEDAGQGAGPPKGGEKAKAAVLDRKADNRKK